jgi:hypothetical protein
MLLLQVTLRIARYSTEEEIASSHSGRVTPMSIQEFHSQLTQADQPSALMSTLSRLTQTDDPQVVEQLTAEDMGIWNGGLAAR